MGFWAIADGDYLDGILARITGQYSRMGALLDPLVDRLTILAAPSSAGASTSPAQHSALALLALRELAMLFLAQYGLRHGVDIEVNWPGRISVFPIMGGIFLALLAPGWVASALLIWGLAMAIAATVLYAQAGLRATRAAPRRELTPGFIEPSTLVEPSARGRYHRQSRKRRRRLLELGASMEDTFPDLGSLATRSRGHDRQPDGEENEISYQRRVLHREDPTSCVRSWSTACARNGRPASR